MDPVHLTMVATFVIMVIWLMTPPDDGAPA